MGEGKKPDGRKSKECKLGRFTKSTGLNLIPRPPAKALPQKTLLFPSLGWEGECEIHFSALGGEGRITGSFFIKSLLPNQPFANFHPFIQAAPSPQTGQGWGLSGSRVKPGKILEQSLVWPQPLPALGSAGTGSSTPGTWLGMLAKNSCSHLLPARQGHRGALPSLHPAGDGMNPLFWCLRI